MGVYPFELDDSYPISAGFAHRCARKASGHATVVPPNSEMNSRRFSGSKCILSPEAWSGLQDTDFAEVSQRVR
jgi:hypothetical protein